MTVSNTVRRAGPFHGNGVTTQFPFTFKVFEADNVQVTFVDDEGNETELTTQFTVALNADQDSSPGGTVTYPVSGSPLADGETLVVTGDLAVQQEASIPSGGRFQAQVIENALDYLTILIQQAVQTIDRQLTFPAADADGPIALPTMLQRAGKMLGFAESTGQPQVTDFTMTQVANAVAAAYVAGTTLDALSFLALGTGAAPRTAQDKLREFVSVKDFGAVGDGVHDDTDALEDACAAHASVYFPEGNYVYNGNGITPLDGFRYLGAGKRLTTITIAAGKYFISSPTLWNGIHVENIGFFGGAGAIQNTATGGLGGSRRKVIHDCEFKSYTRCAIDTNHNDCPYWDIQRNTFDGLDSINTIGVALGRNSDVSVIKGNAFLRNKVHLKLSKPGLVPDISDNDFLQFDAGTQRISVWVTGNNTSRNYVFIHRNKFGNENLAASDYRIALVPEGAGTTNGDKLPDFATLTMDGIHRVDVTGNSVNGAAGNGPLVYSVSQELRGSRIADNVLGGTIPSFLLQFGNAFTDNPLENVYFGENYSEQGITVSTLLNTNYGYYGPVGDPRHLTEGDGRNPNSSLSQNAARVGYTEMLSTRIGAFSLANATKVVNFTDATGGDDAAEFSMTTATGEIYAAWASAPTPGEVFWIECDLEQGSVSPAARVDVRVFSSGASSPAYWQRRITIPATWRTFRFPASIAGAQASRFKFAAVDTGRLKIGRVRVYKSRSPVPHGIQTLDSVKLVTALGASYANDAAAGGAGVQVGELYRNGSVLQIRVT